jgi:Flp pilus assembly protein TadD
MRAAILLVICAAACGRPAPRRAAATTDPAIALGNLDAMMAAQEHLLSRGAGPRVALVELLQARAQILGTVRDYDRAETLAEEAVALAPRDAEARIARASVRASLHRFDEALADLSQAAAQGADIDAPRAAIFQARGDLQAALALRTSAVGRFAGTTAVGALAAAEAAAGDAAAAERDFDRAERAYRDVSPFPPAWIDFQRGLARERRADFAGAKAAYLAALARLPRHAAAAGHLAGIFAIEGNLSRAEELLLPLAALDDPEYEGQLAAVLSRRDAANAARLRTDAAARYEALLARHPEAFADHAARFYLPFDPARALSLARVNLAVRQTWEAFDLALSAAVAARDGATGCAVARRALSLPAPPKRILLLAHRVCSASP